MTGNSEAIKIGINRRNKNAVANEKKANQDDLAADFRVQTKPQYSAENSGGRYQYGIRPQNKRVKAGALE